MVVLSYFCYCTLSLSLSYFFWERVLCCAWCWLEPVQSSTIIHETILPLFSQVPTNSEGPPGLIRQHPPPKHKDRSTGKLRYCDRRQPQLLLFSIAGEERIMCYLLVHSSRIYCSHYVILRLKVTTSLERSQEPVPTSLMLSSTSQSARGQWRLVWRASLVSCPYQSGSGHETRISRV